MTLVNAETGEVVAHSLAECESVIERHLQSFIAVGQALLAIRDQRLYRATHGDFDTYCKDRWGWTKSRAGHLIRASEVVDALGTDVPAPINEAQTRPLVGLPTPEARREAWGTANRQAADEQRPVTAQDVKEAADAVRRALEPLVEPSVEPVPPPTARGTGPNLRLIRASRVIPKVMQQLNGVVIAVADLDVSTLSAEEAAVASSDLSKAIGVLNHLNKRLKEQATDGS